MENTANALNLEYSVKKILFSSSIVKKEIIEEFCLFSILDM